MCVCVCARVRGRFSIFIIKSSFPARDMVYIIFATWAAQRETRFQYSHFSTSIHRALSALALYCQVFIFFLSPTDRVSILILFIQVTRIADISTSDTKRSLRTYRYSVHKNMSRPFVLNGFLLFLSPSSPARFYGITRGEKTPVDDAPVHSSEIRYRRTRDTYPPGGRWCIYFISVLPARGLISLKKKEVLKTRINACKEGRSRRADNTVRARRQVPVARTCVCVHIRLSFCNRYCV